MDPMDILPPEMWKEVFGRVTGAQDWLNLLRASPRFEELVAAERPKVLFAKVVPHLYKYLDKDLAKNLYPRLVCRHWKNGMDTMITALKEQRAVTSRLRYEFREPGKLFLFLEKFENHPSNPIIGQSVEFAYREGNTATEFRNGILAFMTRFGAQIKRLLFFYSLDQDNTTFFHRLRECVQLAPQLEMLGIWNENMTQIRTEIVQEIESITGGGGVPIIPDLKYLVTHWNISDPYLHVNIAPEWNGALVRLCCNPNSLTRIEMQSVPPQLTTFPHLQSATLLVDRLEDVAALRNSPRWPLTHLVWYNYRPPHNGFDYRDMFGLIEQLKETLTSLHVQNLGTPVCACNEDFQIRLDLPRLKSVIVSNFIFLDFLASLKRLEEVWIEQLLGGEPVIWRPEHEEVIQVGGLFQSQNMLRSNIWQIFPKLKKLVCKGRQKQWISGQPIHFHTVYSREQWELQTEKKQ